MKETLEEARANSYIDFAKSNEDVSAYSFVVGWDKGAKWQAERSYSEEEIIDLLLARDIELNSLQGIDAAKRWFEQFKNK